MSTNEESRYDIFLDERGPNIIYVYKMVRELNGIGLNAARELVDFPPYVIKQNVTWEEAVRIQDALAKMNAGTSILPSNEESN